MASRGFYVLSTALVGATAAILWFAVGRDPARSSAAVGGAGGSSQSGDDRALGVRGADVDSARTAGTVEVVSDPSRPGRELALTNAAPPQVTVAERSAGNAPPAAPIAGGPGLAAEAEASAAAAPKVTAAVRADLERRRADLRAACWPPGSELGATFKVEATYGADGSLLALGVPEVPGLPGVGVCLMGQIGTRPPALAEPPGVGVSIVVPVEFAGSPAPPRESPQLRDPSR